MRRRLRTLIALALGSTLLAGCDFAVYDLPLPGGADVGDDPITVTAEFRNVLDLVPQSSVKVNDISVGRVDDVELEGDHALLTLTLRSDVNLPDDAIATIRQTSLLGEKFVSLEAPPDGGSGNPLGNGDVIPLDRTGRNPEIEEVLGALSLVLNGGGVAQLKTITTELNLALEGREDSARSVLTQVSDLMGQLDERKGQIIDAIEALNRLSLSVREHQPSIDQALEELPSALDSIARQREDLVAMLEGLNDLSSVGVRVIQQTKQSTIDSLRQLEPVLIQLGNAGDAFIEAFHVFYAFPFVDDVVGRDPQAARNLHMGDYVNLSIDLDLNLNNLGIPDVVCIPFNQLPDSPLDDLVDLPNLCSEVQDALQGCLKTPPDPQACAALPGHLAEEICDATGLDAICGLLGGGGGGGGRSGTSPDDPIGDILDQLGLLRPGPGATARPRPVAIEGAYDEGLGLFLLGGLTTEGGGR